jgi:hypothetical protein
MAEGCGSRGIKYLTDTHIHMFVAPYNIKGSEAISQGGAAGEVNTGSTAKVTKLTVSKRRAVFVFDKALAILGLAGRMLVCESLFD